MKEFKMSKSDGQRIKEFMFQVPPRVISSVKELTEFLSLNNANGEGDRENINVQQIETFMKNEGFQDSEAILPNFEFQKVLTTKRPQVIRTKEEVDDQLKTDFQRAAITEKNSVNTGLNNQDVPETSPVRATFSFSTLPV